MLVKWAVHTWYPYIWYPCTWHPLIPENWYPERPRQACHLVSSMASGCRARLRVQIPTRMVWSFSTSGPPLLATAVMASQEIRATRGWRYEREVTDRTREIRGARCRRTMVRMSPP